MKQFYWIFACVLGITLCVTVNGQCENRKDGHVVEIAGCYRAKICKNGNVTELVCEGNTVLERDSMSCKIIGLGNTACGTSANCDGKKDGLYADANCQTYYWCKDRKYLANSRNYCSGNLLFYKDGCDYPVNVPASCFDVLTAPPPPTTTTTTTTTIPTTSNTTTTPSPSSSSTTKEEETII